MMSQMSGLKLLYIVGISGTIPIDKISKQDQEKILKALKSAYAKKTYVLDKEVVLSRLYDGKNEKLKDDYFSY